VWSNLIRGRGSGIWPLLIRATALYLVAGAPATAEDEQLPAHFDWRAKGIFTPVKHQGDCGSCGVFAAVAVFEALIKKETGKEVDLSEQQIVSCATGCRCGTGCSSLAALQYMKDNGVVLETDFPYLDRDTTCPSGLRGRYSPTEVYSTEIHKQPLAKRIQIIKRTIVNYGPIATNMGLYDDLGCYISGIYTYDGKAAGQGGYFNSAYGDRTGIDDYYVVFASFDAGPGGPPRQGPEP